MKKSLLIGTCLTAFLLTGCFHNTVNTVENADKNMTPHTISDKRFITDEYLKDRLALKSLTVSKTKDGYMRVQLEAMNVRTGFFAQAWSNYKGDNPYKIRYKFTWFNQDGMAVENTILSDWQVITVIPGETVYIQSVAPGKDCNDFRVNLMEVN